MNYSVFTESPSTHSSVSNHKVDLNCTSTKSKPTAEMRWYINNREAKASHDLSVSNTTVEVHEDSLETSTSRLKFSLTDKHFRAGVVRVKCSASINRLHTMSDEAILRGEVLEKKEYYRNVNQHHNCKFTQNSDECSQN